VSNGNNTPERELKMLKNQQKVIGIFGTPKERMLFVEIKGIIDSLYATL